jgi:hypothetical protein
MMVGENTPTVDDGEHANARAIYHISELIVDHLKEGSTERNELSASAKALNETSISGEVTEKHMLDVLNAIKNALATLGFSTAVAQNLSSQFQNGYTPHELSVRRGRNELVS